MKRLTRKEFMARLAGKRLKWGLVNGMIRHADKDGFSSCPIAALAPASRRWMANCMPINFVEETGFLRRDTAMKIVAAADDDAGRDPRLRAELLRACKLTEEGQ